MTSKPWWDSTIKAALIASATGLFIFYMDRLEGRIDNLEGRIDNRIDGLEVKIDRVETKIDEVRGFLKFNVTEPSEGPAPANGQK